MKIIIIGAGPVGASLAESLTREENDIIVIDDDPKRLRELQDKYDIGGVLGLGSRPDVLRAANAEDADMLIAITESDEVNMVASQLAHTLFDIPTKIIRIRSREFTAHTELFHDSAFPIDVLISPEQLVTEYVTQLIEYPGALQVLDFAQGKVKMVAVKAYYNGPLIGHSLRTLSKHMPAVDIWVPAIYRRGKPILPTAETIFEVDDEVFFVAASDEIKNIMAELRGREKQYKRIMIAGGGNIGLRLAEALEKDFRVKIIDRDPERIELIANELSRTLVLQGDVSDKALLLEENIEETDVFCAVTDDDEANIMSAMLAKRLGARKVMSLINRDAYVDLVQGSFIDIAISPQQATISGVLSHIRKGDVVKDYSLRHGAAEAIEAIAHGDERSSKVIGKALDQVALPPCTTIGAVVKGEEVLIGKKDVVIEENDHVILFLTDKRYIHDVEALFQVGMSYF